MNMFPISRLACFLTALLFAVLLATPASRAQARNVRIEFFGGGSSLKGERAFTVDSEPFLTQFANGGKLGLRGTFDVEDRWSVEFAYSYGANNLRVFDLEETPPRVRAFGTRVHQVTVNVLYFLHSGTGRFRPFATAGLGTNRFNPTSDAKAAAVVRFIDDPASLKGVTKLNFNFGVGLELKATDRFGLRLDLRDHVSRLPRFGVSPALFPVEGSAQDLEASAGIVFYFGR